MRYAFDGEETPKQGFTNNKNPDVWLNLSLLPDEKVKKFTLRLIGGPQEFWECTPYKREKKEVVENGKIVVRYDNVQCKFEDSESNRRLTRVSHPDPSQCYWTQQGYVRTKKYAQVVLNITDPDNPKVQLLNKGKTFFEPIFNREIEQWENREDGDDTWLYAGSDKAPSVKLTVERDTSTKSPNNRSNYKYGLTFSTKPYVLKEKDIDLLKNSYSPTSEELDAIRNEVKEQIAEVTKMKYEDENKKEKNLTYLRYILTAPDWFFCGLKLSNFFTYKPPKTVEVENEEEDLVITKPSNDKDKESTSKEKESELSLEDDDDNTEW